MKGVVNVFFPATFSYATRRRFLILAVSMLSVLGMVALATPAEAHGHTPFDRCRHGQLCLFDYRNGGGRMEVIPPGTRYVGDPFNDRATSFWNRSGSCVEFFDHANYHGAFQFSAQYGPPLNFERMNNRVSSVRSLGWC